MLVALKWKTQETLPEYKPRRVECSLKKGGKKEKTNELTLLIKLFDASNLMEKIRVFCDDTAF